MAKDFAKAFYKSTRWQACRESYISHRIAIDGGLCERCHNAPGYIVHHKVYLDLTNINNPEILLNYNNLEYVCHACHDSEHDVVERLRDSRRKPLLCAFDSEGRPCPSPTAS